MLKTDRYQETREEGADLLTRATERLTRFLLARTLDAPMAGSCTM